MYKVMKALVDINFDGLVIPDHVPELGAPQPLRPSPGLAYSIGYMNATLKAVLSNKGRT
jgi:mannonate dehydratase